MLLSSLIRRIRKELGDCDGDRYEAWHVAQVAQEVACTLFAVSKDLFIEPKEIEVTGGELVNLSGCCDFIQRVEGIIDGNGTVIKELKTTVESGKVPYLRGGCSSGLPDEATIASKEGKHIKLSPPLPPGKKIKIRVWCSSQPKFSKLSDDIGIPCELQSDLIKLIKATLLEVDDDSMSGQTLSDRLTSRAGQMITAKRNQRKEYGAEK
jgi:hypothetical protein